MKAILICIFVLSIAACSQPERPDEPKPEYRCTSDDMPCKKLPPAPEGCTEIAPDIYDCRKVWNR